MDDKQIEELLRGSWSPVEPTGMRERVLRHARKRLQGNRCRSVVIGWKPVLAGICILLVLLANLLDRSCELRITSMLSGAGSSPMMCQRNALGRILETHRLLMGGTSNAYPQGSREGGNLP